MGEPLTSQAWADRMAELSAFGTVLIPSVDADPNVSDVTHALQPAQPFHGFVSTVVADGRQTKSALFRAGGPSSAGSYRSIELRRGPRVSSADEAAAQASRGSANARLIERLRATKPSGRVVLQLERGARDLPDLALEDGDRIFVPPVPSSVGVFGSVFNSNNYLYAGSRTVGDYVQLAGGPTRGADDDSTFVIRANGAVVGGLQSARWLGSNPLGAMPAEPGDTIFVPERLDKTTFLQNAKDWTQILAQFALGAAALKTLGN